MSPQDKDIVLLAINNSSDPSEPGGSHWSLLIYTRQAREFFHLDSSNGMNSDHARRVAKKLFDYLATFPESDPRKLRFTEVPVLTQNNGFDCGVFVCMFAYFLTLGVPVNSLEGAFDQQRIIDCNVRAKIGISILNGFVA